MAHRALVLSGGGSKAAFEVGAVEYLVDSEGLDFDVIAGISAGSLNAAILAQGQGIDGLRAQVRSLWRLWHGIRSRNDVYKGGILGKALAFLATQSLYSSDPLKKKVDENVSPGSLRASGKRLRVGSVCLESGDYRAASEADEQVRELVLASASIPLAFPPVPVGRQTLVDGGVRNLTPLQDAFAALKAFGEPSAEPDEMYVILTSPLRMQPDHRRWKTGRVIAERSVSILMDQVFREDLDYALAINRSVLAYQELERQLEQRLGRDDAVKLLAGVSFPYLPPKFRYVRIRTVIPKHELSDALEFNEEKILEAYDAGKEAAEHPLNEEELQRQLDETEPRRPGKT